MNKQSFKLYFASDLHLGAPDAVQSRIREQRFVRWLDSIKHQASALYLVGDVFDYWYEYQMVVPKGYTRLLGKLAELVDLGIEVHLFTGNHDLWMFGYFEEEIGLRVHHKPLLFTHNDKTFLVGHGDGLGPGDKGYKWLKKYLFTNRFCQFLLSVLHPNLTLKILRYFSKTSRQFGHQNKEKKVVIDRLLVYAQKKSLQTDSINYFVFGHQHCPKNITINPNSQYFNLGDWINYHTYAVFDGENMCLQTFDEA
jgi:UDP-2,3-diacylglucosamine hydrolase